MKLGMFCLAALSSAIGAEAALVHRWSFTGAAGAVTSGTAYADSVAGGLAVVRGTGVVATAGAVTLPGGPTGSVPQSIISGYLDLPNGLVSSKTNLTVEVWATIQGYQTYQRLLDFGRIILAGDGLGAAGEITGLSTNAPGLMQASDALTLTFNRSTANNVSQQRFEVKLNGIASTNDVSGYYRLADTSVASATNVEYHYVVTFEAGAGAFGTNGGRVSWFRDGTNAAVTDSGVRLSQIEDVNNWLGRSLWGADRMANATYNEVRIHDRAFTPSQIAASLAAGPNPSAVVAANDAVTMHRGQKARVAVLANDPGGADPGSVAVTTPPQYGSATADAQGRILYAHTNGSPAGDSFVYSVGSLATNAVSMATVTVTFADSLRIASPAIQVPATPPPSAVQLNLAFGGTAFTDPVCIASPPGDTQRVFVCQKGGLLRVVTNLATGAGGAATFLDLPALLNARGEGVSGGCEQGLLGVAFHPGWASNRMFFVFYTATNGGLTYERVARFQTVTNNPNAADPASEVILISQLDDACNHNGGDLHFGADGYLYISVGDEGNQNDSLNNSQTITKDFYSAILRIDVDKKPGSLAPNHHAAIVAPTNYAIPPDNPYIGVTNFNGTNIASTSVRTEFWAVGFRNPWRFSFDPPTGELWCGDVGGGLREEVDIVLRGSNYGWAYREGTIAGPKTPPAWFTASNHVPPIFDYNHGTGTNEGNSITGGRVYRGTRFSGLVGKYVFADYSSGNLWTLLRNGTNAPAVERIAGQGGIVAFGADPSNGDILLANINNDRIYRLEYGTASGSYPATLDATGLFADLADLSPAPGVMPYGVNLPFWSDNGIKRRWFTMPVATNFATWTQEGTWSNTPGMIWVKHFDFDLAPTNRVRLETRVLVRNAAGGYGVSYRWNTNGTDAALVADEGSNFVLNVVDGLATNPQTWRIPSRAECMTCHNTPAGIVLSFNTRQLNRTNNILGFAGNQLDTLREGGCFANSNAMPSPNLLPRHLRADETQFPAEARVRSYLAVNCAYCHMPGGTAPSAWDGRPHVTLDQTGLILGNAANNGGDPANKLVVPGDAFHSIVLNRIAASNGFTRMPPLGSNLIDTNHVALVTGWILDALPSRQTYNDWRLVQFGETNSPSSAPDSDFDADGHSNYYEFLTGSLPLDPQDVPLAQLSFAGTNVSVGLQLPANRSAQTETSTNLGSWILWDVPGNAGLPTPGGPFILDGPQAGPEQFFRWKLREN